MFLIGATVSKSKMAARIAAATAARRVLAIRCMKWKKEHRVIQNCSVLTELKYAVFPCDWPTHPETDLEARTRKEARVIRLAASMSTHGHQKTDIICLIWLEDIQAAGLNLSDLVFNCTVPLPPCPIQIIAGDHTCAAVQRVKSENPDSDEFKMIECELVVCSRTEQNLRLAKAFGTMHNFLAQLQEGHSFWENLSIIHTERLRLWDLYEVGKERKNAWSAFRVECETSMANFKPNTIGSLFVLASFTGTLWNNIAKIFQGQVTKNKEIKFKTPDAHTHFNSMSKISEDLLIRWTNRVVNGEWNTKNFNDRCLQHKKEVKVCEQMLDFVSVRYPEESYATYDAMAEQYPFFMDSSWVKLMVTWCGNRLVDSLDGHVKGAIVKKIQLIKHPPVTDVVCIVINFCLCIWIVYHVMILPSIYTHVLIHRTSMLLLANGMK
jgi:hypothetical protein